MYCSNCGTLTKETDHFCAFCGRACRSSDSSEWQSSVVTIDLTAVVKDIRLTRACASIPVFLGATLVILSPLSIFVGTRDWHSFLVMLSAGLVFCILGNLVARGSAWAMATLALATWSTAVTVMAYVITDGTIRDRAVTIVAVVALYALISWLSAKGLRAALRHRKFSAMHHKLGVTRKRLPMPRDKRLFEAAKPFGFSLAVFIAGIPIAVLAGAVSPVHGIVVGIVYLPFAIIGSRLYNTAQRLSALRIVEIRKLDTRTPVLFVRSFSDDGISLERRFSLVKLFAPTTFTLEELIVNRSWSVGPVMAIGKPGEQLGPLGAAREYLEGDQWRDRIEVLMSESRLIVSVCGSTAGLLWEYRAIVRLGVLNKMLIVFPPLALLDANRRWQLLERSLWPRRLGSLPTATKSKPLLAMFPNGGEPIVVVSRYQNETAYNAAFDVALSEICRPQES
jgi:RNA polymerase subunit RPABC4/transcription elongation factor Spt4